MNEARWQPGDCIVHREIVHGRPWLGIPVYVVEDSEEHLVTHIPTGAEFGFPPGPWPTPNGLHPWHPGPAWEGHGTLLVQRPGDDYAVWHFWHGPDRAFLCWYINIQRAFRRTEVGYDTQDLELDLVVGPDGTWAFKDWDLVDTRVEEGRFTPEEADWIRGLGEQIAEDLRAGRNWWGDRWVSWEPDPSWRAPSLPERWDQVASA